MNKFPLLLLSGCLVTRSDLDPQEESRCAPQIEALERACEEQTRGFKDAVAHFKACLEEPVRVICSNPGYAEPKVLRIEKTPLEVSHQ